MEFYVFQIQGGAAQNIHQTIIPYQNIRIGGSVSPANYLSEMLTVDLTSLAIFVSVGQQFGFAVHSSIPLGNPQINLFYACDNSSSCLSGGGFGGPSGSYPGGYRIQFADSNNILSDLTMSAVFQTFVDPNAVAPDGAAPCISCVDRLLGTPYTPPPSPVGAVPAPATLPLFATGLGLMGLLAWRNKRKVATS